MHIWLCSFQSGFVIPLDCTFLQIDEAAGVQPKTFQFRQVFFDRGCFDKDFLYNTPRKDLILDALKTAFQARHLTHRWIPTVYFFPKLGYLFSFFRKGQARPCVSPRLGKTICKYEYWKSGPIVLPCGTPWSISCTLLKGLFIRDFCLWISFNEFKSRP